MTQVPTGVMLDGFSSLLFISLINFALVYSHVLSNARQHILATMDPSLLGWAHRLRWMGCGLKYWMRVTIVPRNKYERLNITYHWHDLLLYFVSIWLFFFSSVFLWSGHTDIIIRGAITLHFCGFTFRRHFFSLLLRIVDIWPTTGEKRSSTATLSTCPLPQTSSMRMWVQSL